MFYSIDSYSYCNGKVEVIETFITICAADRKGGRMEIFMKKTVENGIVYEIRKDEKKEVLGHIGKVELTLEYPPEMLGIIRIESSALFGENDNKLMEDNDIIDNQEYHSETMLKKEVAKHYGIPECIIEIL